MPRCSSGETLEKRGAEDRAGAGSDRKSEPDRPGTWSEPADGNSPVIAVLSISRQLRGLFGATQPLAQQLDYGLCDALFIEKGPEIPAGK